ncbi:MAG: TIGR02444 family protein [Pseudomonadota bacterium]
MTDKPETKDATSDESAGDTEGFWDWSNRVYRLSGVADRLINLQDANKFDVNLVLWCVWLGLHVGAVKPKAVRKAVAAAEDWDAHVVKPLRAARKALKSAPGEAEGADALRKKVKDAELEAERIEQSLLEGLAPSEADEPASNAAARSNLLAYRDALGSSAPDEVFDPFLESLSASADDHA